MVKQTNPAAQLLTFMRKAKQQNGDQPALYALCATFECSVEQPIVLASHLLKLERLCVETKDAIVKNISGDTSIFVAPITTIEEIFTSLTMTSAWSYYSRLIDPVILSSLAFINHSLTQIYSGASLEHPQNVRDLIIKLDELLEACLICEIDSGLKKVIAKHLERLRAALIDYRLEGSDSLQRLLDEVVGSMHRNSQAIKDEAPEGKAFVGRFFEVIGQMNDLVSGYQNLALLAPATAPLFLPLIS